MKNIISFFLLIVLITTLVSCADINKDNDFNTDDTSLQADRGNQPSDDTAETNDPDPADTAETNDSNTADTTENTYSANGGTGGCNVHSEAYHGFPHELIEHTNEEEYREWFDTNEKMSENYNDNGCIWTANIYDFVHELNIPKEVFVDFYNRSGYYYYRDYDIDLLYNGTAEENDAYYRDYSERENTVMAKRGAFDQVKGYIITTRFAELQQALGEKMTSFGNVSLAEAVYVLEMSREELEAIIAQSKELVPNVLRYDYDLDLIYNQREYVEGLIEEHSAFYVDLLFCGEEPREEAYPLG